MAQSLPLPTLLSQVLVAFTVEFDNEFERQMPHRTTSHGSTAGSTGGPWLVSLVMWLNCMRFVGKEKVTVGEIEELARTATNWNGLQRWGYIFVETDPADSRPKPTRRDWVVRATPKGRQAQEVWRPLFGIIEKRFQARFGSDAIHELRQSLWAVASRFDIELPDCLPILGYGLFSRGPDRERRAPAGHDETTDPQIPLSALLSRVLLAFALEFEHESEVSLAISANVLRLLGEKAVRVRDLPRLSGVSKEAIAMSLGFLERRRLAVLELDPAASRTKLARLTPKGQQAHDTYLHLLSVIEQGWQARFGENAIDNLRDSLERLVGDPAVEVSPLFSGLEPYPDGWRASVPKPCTLPHYPMVLHRGGYPDGS